MAAAAGLTRANLPERTLVILKRGSCLRPDVLLVDSDRGRAVVKDFARRAWPVRAALGRFLVRREVAIYRILEGIPAVPDLLGRIDAFAFAVEHRGGVRFSHRRPWTFTARFVGELRTAVAALHERGVVHLDLSHRSNVRAGTDGRPVLIDFESALHLDAANPVARALLALLRRVDERALKKWKAAAGTRTTQPSAGGSAGASGSGLGDSRPM